MDDGVLVDETTDFMADVIEGLSAPRKSLPCKYFYDAIGSDLFEQITQTMEYYPTRTEHDLLKEVAPILTDLLVDRLHIIEYGAGALIKIRYLLDAVDGAVTYVPIDVSEEFLKKSAVELTNDYKAVNVKPVAGEFLDPNLNLPQPSVSDQVVAFFPGSTLGNFKDAEIKAFLEIVRKHVGDVGRLLLGVDVNQDRETVIPAYNDAKGITSAFNLNLLVRINRELGADFEVTSFDHEAIWNEDEHQIEMYLTSACAQTVTIGQHKVDFREGERIHTENSRKFDLDSLKILCGKNGWDFERVWFSDVNRFAMILLK